jgi:CBS domain-containing protein
MRIADILRKKGRQVVTIEADLTVYDAIQTLVSSNIGSLVVTGEDGRVVGIITERDILREAQDRGERLKETPIGDVMTRDVIIGVPGDRVDYVMGIMTQNRIRHLPVMDGDGLAGIISIGDVVNASHTETEIENRMLRDYIHGVAR